MKKEVIAVTGPFPYDETLKVKPGFDDNELHKHGVVFEDGFVSYAEMTVGDLEALAEAEGEEAYAAMQEAYAAFMRLPPEDRVRAVAQMSPETRSRLGMFIMYLNSIKR